MGFSRVWAKRLSYVIEWLIQNQECKRAQRRIPVKYLINAREIFDWVKVGGLWAAKLGRTMGIKVQHS